MEFVVCFVLIGICAGWIAGQLTKGRGFGIEGDLVIGVIGALVGGFAVQLIGLRLHGMLGELIVATVGAVLFLAVLRVVERWPHM